MTFDYTYITIKGFPVFEPMTMLTNTVLFGLSWSFFRRLRKYSHDYANQMAWFLVMLGLSAIFGGFGHAVHYQLGTGVFNALVFLMNASGVIAVFFCFRAPYTYHKMDQDFSKKLIYFTILWCLLLMAISTVNQNLEFIKLSAGIALLYSLFVHYSGFKNRSERGNKWVVTGILVSFLPIISHSLKISPHQWFNYKDISHVIMIISLIIIYKGVSLNVEDMERKEAVLI